LGLKGFVPLSHPYTFRTWDSPFFLREVVEKERVKREERVSQTMKRWDSEMGQLREHGHYTDTLHQNAAVTLSCNPASALFSKRRMARPERLELPTLWFEARCSIQLSYGRAEKLNDIAFDPAQASEKEPLGKDRRHGEAGKQVLHPMELTFSGSIL
jgi:hypothetical protein